MAWLVPATRKIDEIRPFAEQEVVKTFVEKLSKDWVVIPKVHITFKGQNAEIDVILVSRNRGVFFVEVKGGEISIDNGQWKSRDEKGDVHNIQNPIEQLVSAKHQLVKRLGKMNFSLNDLFIRDLVVLPKNTEVPRDGLGPGLPRESIFTKLDLEDPEAALARIVREHAPIELNRFKAFIQILCPTVRFTDEGGEFHQTVLHRVDEATSTRLGALVGLADNQRVLATGAAGTGKTYLAERWARRCAERGERTLLVCYNLPLSQDLENRLEDSGADVFSFHRLARSVLSPSGFVVPENAGSEWWDTVPAQNLIDQRDVTTVRYDTIVVDEGQDFRPTWWDALDTLFAPDGPRRLLVAADPLQAIYAGPWVAPANMMSITLETNVRSTLAVGSHVKDLGGAKPNSAAPAGSPVKQVRATVETVASLVAAEITRFTADLQLPPSHIAILARHRELRELLIGSDTPVKLARWEERDEDSIVCETIHRVKGLERLAIIVVDLDEKRTHELDYIGASRAVLHLTVITR